MDQQKVGRFLRELRNQKSLTQEQLAEMLGVTNRSVSRWENGVTMPDFDLLIQLSTFYDVEIGEILDGERKVTSINQQPEETLLKIADYHQTEKKSFAQRLHYGCMAGLGGMIIYALIDLFGLTAIQPYRTIVNVVLGIVIGALITGAIYTSQHMSRIRAAKIRLWERITNGGQKP